jgi:hypothetical protein
MRNIFDPYIWWTPGREGVRLEGDFPAPLLTALAIWLTQSAKESVDVHPAP